jgi:hypothetical protein
MNLRQLGNLKVAKRECVFNVYQKFKPNKVMHLKFSVRKPSEHSAATH